jgi:hypothetical protein
MAIPAPHPSLYVSLGIAALVVWRLYSRVRRMVGRQKLSRRRPRMTVILFPVLLAMLLIASLAHPLNLVALIAGAGLGAALGLYGLRLTTFEETPQGLFYTPSAHLGIALSLLFIGRIAFRIVQFTMAGDDSASWSSGFARSPLTLVIFGTLAGYYVAYAIGLLRWERRVGTAPAVASASAPAPAPTPAAPQD